MLLLRTLAAGGASLRYHGDLDGEGVRLAAYALSPRRARHRCSRAASGRLAARGSGRSIGVLLVRWPGPVVASSATASVGLGARP
ncbi:DUF2399 domain-containing protein [Pseudonocardia sp.]|uniref:DUF2399 domain-containing protein n=1 Tax=Pseudonocardia sp. TaxID=60912 RepID=UPI003431C240